MWHFAAGAYLVKLADGVLLLAAIYGLTSSVLVLLLGGIIGNWVDFTERMKGILDQLFFIDYNQSLVLFNSLCCKFPMKDIMMIKLFYYHVFLILCHVMLLLELDH